MRWTKDRAEHSSFKEREVLCFVSRLLSLGKVHNLTSRLQTYRPSLDRNDLNSVEIEYAFSFHRCLSYFTVTAEKRENRVWRCWMQLGTSVFPVRTRAWEDPQARADNVPLFVRVGLI